MLSNDTEIEVMCFLTYRLISSRSDAAFIGCDFNLVQGNSINPWRCLQYKEDKNAERGKKTLMPYFMSPHYATQAHVWNTPAYFPA